tara:strand:+ start:7400 stop:7654 length:255 start_codon:yes stop_codon:yes gene_type:complete
MVERLEVDLSGCRKTDFRTPPVGAFTKKGALKRFYALVSRKAGELGANLAVIENGHYLSTIFGPRYDISYYSVQGKDEADSQSQ